VHAGSQMKSLQAAEQPADLAPITCSVSSYQKKIWKVEIFQLLLGFAVLKFGVLERFCKRLGPSLYVTGQHLTIGQKSSELF
jgi:hypothetical protein